MPYFKHIVLTGLLLILGTPAYGGIGIAGKASTLGIGIEGTISLVPGVNARGGLNFFNYTYSGNQGDTEFDTKLKLKSFAILLDLHPFYRRGFRLSGGVVINNNELNLDARPTEEYTIGNFTYPAGQVGSLIGLVDFQTTAPYVGIGWGNAVGSRIGIVFDLGVALQGSPNVSLTASGPIASDPEFLDNLDREERDIQDDIKEYKYYPVLSLGISFRLL